MKYIKVFKRLLFVLFFLLIINFESLASSVWKTDLKSKLEFLADSLTNNLKPWEVPDKCFKVEDFGAIADGKTINTTAIQNAIDSCSLSGGGVVLFSNGDYVTGTIQLKSGVMIEVKEGSRILGSTSLSDYPEMIEEYVNVMSHFHKFRQSLIYAEKADKIGVRGEGEIYFRGERVNFPGPQTVGEIVGRPFGIRIIECKNIVFQDIFLHNSAAWMVNIIYSEDIIFDGVKIHNHANYNNDGLDPDGCRNLIVRNCFFNTEDDAMCPKGGSHKVSENYLIENSTFITTCNAFKIGTDTQGAFRNIIARNLILGGIPDSLSSSSGRQSSTGITIATVDGGNVENFYMHDITINQARCPVFIRIGKRGRVLPGYPKPVGYIKDIVIENVDGKRNFRQGSFISGLPGHPIENIIIRNVELEMEGGGTEDMAGAPVAENEWGYPDAHQFSVSGLPAHGFFVRHANDILFDSVYIMPVNKDLRPMFISGGNTENILVNGFEIEKQQIKVFNYTPKFIKGLKVNVNGSKAKVDSTRNGAMIFTDRTFMFTSIPDILKGSEFICWENNSKSVNNNELITFNVTQNGTIFIAHDNRIAKPNWLTENFTKTNSSISVSGTSSTLWERQVEKNEKVVTGQNQIPGTETGDCNNYIVFFLANNNETGSINHQINSLFQLWPNPANNMITIRKPGEKEMILSFFDFKGNQLQQVFTSSEYSNIDISNFKQGIYIINASSKDLNITRKLIIQK